MTVSPRRAASGGPLPMHPAWVPVALDPGAQARANPRGGPQAQQRAFKKKADIQGFTAVPLMRLAGWSSDPSACVCKVRPDRT